MLYFASFDAVIILGEEDKLTKIIKELEERMVVGVHDDFDSLYSYIKDIFTQNLIKIHKSYSGYSILQLQRLLSNINCVPEFLGYETYLMFRPRDVGFARKIVNAIVPFHVAMIFFDKVVDGDFSSSPEVFLAIDLLFLSERELFSLLSCSCSLHIYDYYLKMAGMFQRACYEKALLTEDCSFLEYQSVIRKLSSSFAMCTVGPALMAGVTDRNILDALDYYARHIYTAFQILDDIRDAKEDQSAHRPNFVVFCGSKRGAVAQCCNHFSRALGYIDSIHIKNYHKEYIKELTKFFMRIAEREG